MDNNNNNKGGDISVNTWGVPSPPAWGVDNEAEDSENVWSSGPTYSAGEDEEEEEEAEDYYSYGDIRYGSYDDGSDENDVW